ncbi:MAG: hypothetical protein JF597_34135 [Streptomyces sp.]|uniref:hypothetical protein n=1 Tax=Streptomyces sp. TaxID=1931 RepID=UPI0025E13B15|nr:hypothetical protein [Streptomyces sp.]MBW8798438.1 hypothetical protein [Streptomyces sp.]
MTKKTTAVDRFSDFHPPSDAARHNVTNSRNPYACVSSYAEPGDDICGALSTAMAKNIE